MKRILIVGKNYSGLRNKLNELGYSYIVLRDVKSLTNRGKKYKNTVIADFATPTGIMEAVNSIEQNIDGVVCVYENYIRAASLVSSHLGLPGLPKNAATACTDKSIMRELFQSSDANITPSFTEVRYKSDLIEFADNHGYPLILKPANLAKSLLVTKNKDLDELLVNYNKMIKNIGYVYGKYAPNSTPKIIVEEFMEGPIFSVDAFIDKKGTPYILKNVVDYQTGFDIGYDDNFHYSRIIPSRLSKKDIESIRKVAEKGCLALGMKSSPAHIEIILTNKGPRIVEIGARNGGYRERMHKLANGIDIYKNTIDLSLGIEPSIKAIRNDYCAVLELFPKKKGLFRGIFNEETLMKLESLEYYTVKQKVGNYVGKSSDGYKMCAIIILFNQNEEKFLRDLEYVNENVFVLSD